jgi:uncharacterized protein (DUF1786 family)
VKILTADIGTGTQDIFLYDSHLDLENGLKMVVPSPTLIVHRRLKEATRRRLPVLLTGATMGGGPSQWAAEAHIRAGLPLFTTPDAARSFNDDLSAVTAMGVQIIGEDEARRMSSTVQRLQLCDFDIPAISAAFAAFGVSLSSLDALAIAAFDHGAAPPEISDRQFRFEYLEQRIRAENRLSAFAYRADNIPPILTRLQSVAHSARDVDAPLVVMDSAPAAVLGATFDPIVADVPRKIIVNVGNLHSLAFRLGPAGIAGVFEHHTGLLTTAILDGLLEELAVGSLSNAAVFDHHGHGACVFDSNPFPLTESPVGVVVTGPRRSLMAASRLRPYFAVPFGDMMISGCFGLLAATADMLPEHADSILASLRREGGTGTAPWDVD